MATKINMKNDSGRVEQVSIGFSWTVLFFGFWPALFRGDAKWAVVILLVQIATAGISRLVFAFIYNKIYIKELIGSGYKAGDDFAINFLDHYGIVD